MEAGLVEAPQGANLPAVDAPLPTIGRGVESKNILISTLFLLQKTSPMIDEDPDLKPGMIIDTVSKKAVGHPTEGLMFIPLSYTTDWVIMKYDAETDQYKWHGFEEYTPDNANLPWNWEEGQDKFRRDERLSFFCLLPDQIENEIKDTEEDDWDPDSVVLPVRICFKRTSFAAGKVLLTWFAKIEEGRRRGHKVPYYHSIFNIKPKLEKNKANQSYQVFEVEKITKTPDAQKAVCESWTKQMAEREIKIDESIETEPTGQPIQKAAPVNNAAEGVGDQF